MRASVSSESQLTNSARARATDRWLTKCFDTEGWGGEKGKRLQGKTAIVPLPSATREKGRRPVLSRRKNGSGYACIFNIFPAYKIFLCLFENISPNIPRYMRFISLFVVLLREYIYPGISSFSKYFRKIFFEAPREISISIDLGWNIREREENYKRNIERVQETRFSFFRNKKSRFKSIFDVKSPANAKNHRSRALWRMEKLPLLLLFRGKKRGKREKKRKEKTSGIQTLGYRFIRPLADLTASFPVPAGSLARGEE